MVIEIQDLSFSYGRQTVLQKISCTFHPGRIYAILGVNGAGKSTMISLLAGFLKPETGTIALNNDSLHKLSLSQLARKIAFVPQQQQLSDLTVSDYLMLGRIPHICSKSASVDEESVFATLEKLQLQHLALRPLAKLSGGELQKTALARALVQQTEVLLLDEPTSSLDMKNQLEVMEIIVRETANNALTTIITMHDVNLALRFADQFVLMKEKRILASGGLEVMSAHNLSELYDISVQIYRDGKTAMVSPVSSGAETDM